MIISPVANTIHSSDVGIVRIDLQLRTFGTSVIKSGDFIATEDNGVFVKKGKRSKFYEKYNIFKTGY